MSVRTWESPILIESDYLYFFNILSLISKYNHFLNFSIFQPLVQEIRLAKLFPKFKTLKKKIEFQETISYGVQQITYFCYGFCVRGMELYWKNWKWAFDFIGTTKGYDTARVHHKKCNFLVFSLCTDTQKSQCRK